MPDPQPSPTPQPATSQPGDPCYAAFVAALTAAYIVWAARWWSATTQAQRDAADLDLKLAVINAAIARLRCENGGTLPGE